MLTPGWRLLLGSPFSSRWWWGKCSTTRRSAVDRITATMMFANRIAVKPFAGSCLSIRAPVASYPEGCWE